MPHYTIPDVNLPHLQEKIKSLNKRAKKLGCNPATLSVIKTEWETVTDELGNEVYPFRRLYYTVEVTGSVPKLNGWTFAAIIEPTSAGNLIKLVPPVEDIPKQFYQREAFCEHCNKKRTRKEVFVLFNEEGQWIQVGRNCLADYLGSESAEDLAEQAEWLSQISREAYSAEDEGYLGKTQINNTEPIVGFLSAVALMTRTYGFKSKKKHEFESTADTAWLYVKDKIFREEETSRGIIIEKKDIKLAEQALAWAKSIEPATNFEHNLQIIASLDIVDREKIGIAAYIIQAYINAKTQEATKYIKRHVGEIGQRVTLVVRITGVLTFPPREWWESTRHLVKMVDENGNILAWWTATSPDWIDEKGEVTIKATVKEHSYHNGIAQTILTRVVPV